MSVPGSHFDRLYAADTDPWGFEERWYERRKYALTLAALPEERVERALELGCSIGVLTVGLAARCAALVAVDVAAAPLAQARERAAALPHVRFEQLALPDGWPAGGPFDLVVLSEMGYYLDEPDLGRLLDRIAGDLRPGGHVVAVHWRGHAVTEPLTGDRVHELLAAHGALAVAASYHEPAFRLDVLQRA